MNSQAEMLRAAKLLLRDGLAKANPIAEINSKGYVADWRSNLLPGVDTALIEADLRAGKGSELRSKFLAAHSSSALAVNVFGPFRNGVKTFSVPGLGELTLQQFERTFPAGVPGRTPPHLDASAFGARGIVAIESKCLEYFTAKSAAFAPAYQQLQNCRNTPWFAEMERLRENPKDYRALDAAQLIKHAFGLINSAGPDSSLLYLFWEPSDAFNHGPVRQHRIEIQRFAKRVAGGGPDFHAMSYPELWTAWAQGPATKLREHSKRLSMRYGGSLSSSEGKSGIPLID